MRTAIRSLFVLACALAGVFLVARVSARRVVPNTVARFWEPLEGRRVACQLCPRQCIIADGARGACGARENRGGTLYSVVYGRPCSVAEDPIEKAPFYHFLPGTMRLGIATPGCNQSCKYCQNWEISQATVEQLRCHNLSPDSVVALAQNLKLPTICFTYSEPTVFYEYMFDIAVKARAAGIKSVVVTSGFISEEPLRQLCRVVDAIKIDLKGFDEGFYRDICGTQLAPVLRSLEVVRQSGVHLEIVNLVVPTLNDSLGEIRDMCRWIRDHLGPDVPLHFTRFMPAYRLTNLPPTPVTTLEQAIELARAEDLNYVYIGNVPGHEANNTYCPSCGRLLIRRIGYDVIENNICAGHCRFCSAPIRGVWE
ncbi:MAG: AmmeMemoRadiSam system radical SAM enzyme [candidate division WOR-3 bacterium]